MREALRFDVAALAVYMHDTVPGFEGGLEVVQFEGGQSNPTYLLASRDKRYVLRRKPPGKLLPSAHAVDREYRIMTALQETGVPVPKTFAYCEDPGIVGTPFFLMEYLRGRVFWDAALPDLRKEQRRAAYNAMTRVLAELHQVNYRSVGLETFGKPGNYVGRQIARWSKQYIASELEKIPAMHALIEWLPENVPAEDETSIVHGDYRIDNLIFDLEEPRVIGVVDWELSTLGHPLGDLSYYCMNWRLPTGLSGNDLSALGLPLEREIVADYCQLTGRSEIPNWEFYMVYNLFRIAAILQGVAARAAQGNAASAHALERTVYTKPIAAEAWKLAQSI